VVLFDRVLISTLLFSPLRRCPSSRRIRAWLIPSYTPAVQAGCKKWPKLNGRDDRDLLEITANVSNVITSITPTQAAIQTVTSVVVEPPTGSAEAFELQIRQSSCLNWLQAPNSTVCCDQNSGEWIEAPIQEDTIASDPACPTVVDIVGQNGEMVASDTQTAPAAARTTFSIVQQNYCTGEMRLPNSTVCCDMSSGVWVPAPVIRDTVDTNSIPAACPTTNAGSGWINT